MRYPRITMPLLAGWIVAGCSDPAGPIGGTFQWSDVLDAGDEIEIKGVNGSIGANRAAGSRVVVSARLRGHHSDPADVDIEVVTHAGGVTICAVYPDVPGRLPNRCAPGDDGRMNTDGSDVEVSFTVSVPTGVTFVGKTVNGSVTASDLESDAFAATVNGDVTITTSWLGSAMTVNGSVVAVLGASVWDRDLDFATVNGNVTVEVPSGTDADVTLTTVNGTIDSDFPLSQSAPGVMRGTIGTGGWELLLATVNGNVALERGP